MLIYVAIMKGVSWGIGKISNIIAGPEPAADITIAFKGGGKLTVRPAEYGPAELENSVERAAAGEKVELNPPVPKPPRPSLTEVPSVKDGPKAFRRWFNELTPEELNAVWKNPKLMGAVERGLGRPNGQHEWLMIARNRNSSSGESRQSRLLKCGLPLRRFVLRIHRVVTKDQVP